MSSSPTASTGYFPSATILGMRQNALGPTAKPSFGKSLKTLSPSLLTPQPIRPTSLPEAQSAPTLPTALSSAFWRTVQLLTITRSASASPAAFSCPAASNIASTASESRTFIWQP